MSKSKGNVINPDEIVAKYGADTLRMYEMFIGPFDQMVAWSDESLEGVFRFLKRVWTLANTQITNDKYQTSNDEVKRQLARLTKKIDEDLEAAKFNTAVAAMMEFVNWWTVNTQAMSRDDVLTFLKLLAPMAPFISEELFQRLNGKTAKLASIHAQSWPVYEEAHLEGGVVTVVVQVDGKMRGKLDVPAEKAGEQAIVEAMARELPNTGKYLGEKQKIVFVPKRLVNFINI
jgi:leucyl-tRNA synthetase